MEQQSHFRAEMVNFERCGPSIVKYLAFVDCIRMYLNKFPPFIKQKVLSIDLHICFCDCACGFDTKNTRSLYHVHFKVTHTHSTAKDDIRISAQCTWAWHPSPSCRLSHHVLGYSWRSTTLSLRRKLTSSTANLECCHVHFSRDSYSTFIRRVIWAGQNSMKLFFNVKFDSKSSRNRDWATSHNKQPVFQSPARDNGKLTNVWSMCFGTNPIIENWHWCLGVMWRKRNSYFEK